MRATYFMMALFAVILVILVAPAVTAVDRVENERDRFAARVALFDLHRVLDADDEVLAARQKWEDALGNADPDIRELSTKLMNSYHDLRADRTKKYVRIAHTLVDKYHIDILLRAETTYVYAVNLNITKDVAELAGLTIKQPEPGNAE